MAPAIKAAADHLSGNGQGDGNNVARLHDDWPPHH